MIPCQPQRHQHPVWIPPVTINSTSKASVGNIDKLAAIPNKYVLCHCVAQALHSLVCSGPGFDPQPDLYVARSSHMPRLYKTHSWMPNVDAGESIRMCEPAPCFLDFETPVLVLSLRIKNVVKWVSAHCGFQTHESFSHYTCNMESQNISKDPPRIAKNVYELLLNVFHFTSNNFYYTVVKATSLLCDHILCTI